jgi:transient receptor potential cation channel subfamily A member 1
MVSHGRVELLAHPLSQKYLQMKWNSYGKYFHLANLLFYSVFLLFVTLFSSLMMQNCRNLNGNVDKVSGIINIIPKEYFYLQYFHIQQNTTNHTGDATAASLTKNNRNYNYDPHHNYTLIKIHEHVEVTTIMMISGTVIVFYILSNTIRELVQIYQQRWHYLLEPNNLVAWILYISAFIMVSPMFFSNQVLSDAHFSAASITVFFSWFNLLLFLQRFDQVISKYRYFQQQKCDLIILHAGGNICGDVPGDSSNSDQGANGIFDFDHRLWLGFLHFTLQDK